MLYENNPFMPREFKDEETLITFLRHQGDEIHFFDCTFEIQGDFGSKLLSAKIPGIETPKPDNIQGSTGWVLPGFFISNVRFTKPVSFNHCKFNGPIFLTNVYFEKGCTFIDSECESSIDFTGVEFLATSQFRSVKAKRPVAFTKCVIHSVEIGFRHGVYQSGLYFFNCSIEGQLDLGNSTIKDILLIRQCKVNGKLNISNAIIDGLQLIGDDKSEEPMQLSTVSLKDSSIAGQLQIHRVTVSDLYVADDATFSSGVFISRSHFYGDCLWTSARFEKLVHIEKTTFDRKLNFSNANFEDRVSIWRTDYQHAQIYFANAKFRNNVSLGTNLNYHKRVPFKGLLSFQGAVFDPSTIVRIFGLNSAKEPNGEIDFTNTLVKGLVDIREVYINKISFDGSVVIGNIQENGTILGAIKDANSARLLKHESRKINNHLAALRYYRSEMNLYSKTIKWYKGDRIPLLLNRISNDFGLSWTRGVVFTVVSGLCCYSLFRSQVGGFKTSEFWAGFINYFWLPAGFNELTNQSHPTTINGGVAGAVSFILGKILIAYGIYQIIAAFRKHLQ